MRILGFVLPLAICAGLATCAHRLPVLDTHHALISGRNTAQLDPTEAERRVLMIAAAITVDHGYRYFRILDPVRPGADVTIDLYGAGEIDPRSARVWDADAVAAGQAPGK